MFKKFLSLFKRKKKFRRVELVFANYDEKDYLIRNGWVIADEEHYNRQRDFVYLEKLEEEK